jgi:hypothetical protein
MGNRVVRPAGTTAAPGGVAPEPTWTYLVLRGGPTFAAEGIVPVLVFYAVLRVYGLAAGIAVATAVSAAVLAWQVRRGQGGTIAWLTLVFLGVQAVVGLASASATVYLAQPVVLSAGWGVAYLVSAAIGRPLIGLFATAWYPFPPEFRAGRAFRGDFGFQSVVWGVFMLLRAALRLAALLGVGVAGFVVVSVATGAPAFAALVAWGVWHARTALARNAADAPTGPAPFPPIEDAR